LSALVRSIVGAALPRVTTADMQSALPTPTLAMIL
jgi:hypothetical protein